MLPKSQPTTLNAIAHDPNLKRWSAQLDQRWQRFQATLDWIQRKHGGLEGLTALHHRGLWVGPDNTVTYTEYAPGASAVSLVGQFNNFDSRMTPLRPLRGEGIGVWRCVIPPLITGDCAIPVDSEVAVEIVPAAKTIPPISQSTILRRVPAQIYRSTQALGEPGFRGRMSRPPREWPNSGFEGDNPDQSHRRPLRPSNSRTCRIYEAHIGASSGDAGALGTFESFRRDVLPRVIARGYNTIQLMGIAEHPFYPSFGYQVSSFFAPSSRFGPMEELLKLIDEAHRNGIRVLMDLVHAHACSNEVDGLNHFDGTADSGYFKPHWHPEWKTRLFDYSQPEVLRFLLSNLRFWTMRVGFDGFRFDAVTSMLFRDHGLARSFSGDYREYFGPSVDEDAVTYLMLAHHLLEILAPGELTTIAEDVSGYPTLCLPVPEGGLGFTFRLGLGIPDMWFSYLKKQGDLDIQASGFIAQILSSLMSRRATFGEKTVAFVESHDQCIVGGSTSAQWLFAGDIYNCMSKFQESTKRVEMAMAWHKLLRMLTHTLGGESFLNFMGNEFGHPEWLDLPGPHNHYSQDHAYRKWNLADDTSLRFSQLLGFDTALNQREEALGWLAAQPAKILLHDETRRRLVYARAGLLFIYNLHATLDWNGAIPSLAAGRYDNILDSDEGWYGGTGRASRHAIAIQAASQSVTQAKFMIKGMLVPPRTGVILKQGS